MLKHITALVLLCLCVFDFDHGYGEQASDYEVIEEQAKVPILSSTFAERKTLKLRLANGLQAYLVSDPNTDKSAAALVVKTGSWEDPKDYPGIAHFLEHMLFLGTKKYPKESEFESFVGEHDGLTNAFTSIDFTGFVFTIQSNALAEALDRFSNFFIEPLFNPSGVARELQAIDQEYAQNVENDDIREYYIHKELTIPDHPNHAFSMGNAESLRKVSQDTLKKWYHEHYSANRMRLVVISDLPLDQLKQIVIHDFKDIPNTNLPLFELNLKMLPQDVKGHLVYIEPIKNMRQLSLIWELPGKFAAMRDSKPELIACQVLGHEGKGSLLAALKHEKLAEDILCSGSKMGPNNFEFALQISLTDAGVKDLDTVILRCFEAIANFKKKGVQKYLFDEMKKMSTLSYQYQGRENAFEHILKEAQWSSEEDLATYPEQSLMIKEFDPKAVEELLSYLTPDNCVFDLIAPEKLTKITYDKKEEWLGVSYTIKPIPEKTLKLWSDAKPNPDIVLPAPNPFIPDKMAVPSQKTANQNEKELIPHPDLLADNEMAKVYFAKDKRYLIPKVSWTFEIKTPAIDVANPKSIVLGDLYVKNAADLLSDFTYPATLAGLEFSLTRSDNGLLITIDGYSDKAKNLFFNIIKTLKDPRPREPKFKIFKNSLLRQYQNAALENPLEQAYDMLKSIIYKQYATNKAKAAAIRGITFDQFDQFVSTIFNKIFIESTLYGNSSKQESKELVDQLLVILDSHPYPKTEQLKKEVIVLPENAGPFFLEMKSKAQGNAAVLAIEAMPFSFQTKAAQQVLMQAMKDPFFDDLRTKQQTGYLVLNQPEEFELHLFNTFLVQSNSHDVRDLLARFELFIEQFLQEMEQSSLPKQRFENIKQALTFTLQQPPNNISEMGSLLHKLAFTYQGDFDWRTKRIKGLQDLTYTDFVTIARQTMGKQNKRRLGILLKGIVPTDKVLQYHKFMSLKQLLKIASYQPGEQPIRTN